MRKAVLVEAKRTAIGNFGGVLKDVPASRFTGDLIKGMLAGISLDPGHVNEVILGNVLQAGQGQNPARQAAILAGLPIQTPAYTINKVCGSGLKAITLGAQAVMLGDADCIVAGGMENMSRSPHLVDCARWGAKFGNLTMVDSMIKDGLWDAFNDYHMGQTAENIAEKYAVSRDAQDRYAVLSQQKCEKAQLENRFRDEILPLEMAVNKNEKIIFDRDEYPRAGTTLDKLSTLKPAFKKDGTVTAANASGLNDGAAAVVLMTEEKAKQLNLTILAEVIAFASCGLEPALMGMGGAFAAKKALDKAGLTTGDIDLFELNEAFACQSVAVVNALGIDPGKVNVNGGSIALGHPIGASGARIVVTLVHEMIKRRVTTGLAALCIGGGQGISVIVRC